MLQDGIEVKVAKETVETLRLMGFFPVEYMVNGYARLSGSLFHSAYGGNVDFSATAPNRILEVAVRKAYESGIESGRKSVQYEIKSALGLI